MVDLSRIDPRIAAMIAGLQQKFPQVAITSGFRDPARNAAVGGARGSQHLSGNAFDFSVRGIPEDQQRAVVEYLRGEGAQGFGYYPNSQSMHADIGSQRYWGPDKTSKSLNQTPLWFQEVAGIKNPVQVAALDNVRASVDPANIQASAPVSAAAPAGPVYSPDLLTQARLYGNKFFPDTIDAPTPMTPEQIGSMQSDLAQGAGFMKGAQGLMSLASLLQPKEEPPPEPPQILPEDRRRREFRPIARMRGLLG